MFKFSLIGTCVSCSVNTTNHCQTCWKPLCGRTHNFKGNPIHKRDHVHGAFTFMPKNRPVGV